MQISHLALDRLVAAQLVQLRNDQSVLERTFEQLSSSDMDRTLRSRFLQMLVEVEARVAQLERMLNHMETSYGHSSYHSSVHNRVHSARPTGGLG